jgi:nicotinamide-nucleotide amidase
VHVEVLAVGDELLTGATQDTNSSFVARELFALGLPLARVTIVGDEEVALRDEFAAAFERSRALIVTGGLGPTVDDRTKEVAAAFFDDPLELDAETLADIRSRFVRRGRPMPEINVKQAMLPRGARKIPNPLGSAPGVHWSRAGREAFLLPGVPAEMRAMFSAAVLPILAARFAPRPGRFAAFRSVGVAESELAERLAPVIAAHADVTWAFYPAWGGVDVKLRQARAPGEDDALGDAAWNELRALVRAALGPACYSEDADEALAAVVQRRLVARGLKLALAESCTGGLVGARLTDVAGASACFTGGFVTYADAAKTLWLDVPEALLAVHGAVSAECAAAMARGARARAASDLAVAVTGVAGPDGGTADKQVGLVFLALAAADGCWTRRLQLFTQREMNRWVASQLALDLVRRHLANLPVGDPA